MSELHQKQINIWPRLVASLEQIGECDLATILNFVEKMKKEKQFS